jgi:hypothetical protein
MKNNDLQIFEHITRTSFFLSKTLLISIRMILKILRVFWILKMGFVIFT